MQSTKVAHLEGETNRTEETDDHWCPRWETILPATSLGSCLRGVAVPVLNGLAKLILEERYIERHMSDRAAFQGLD